MSAVAGFRPCLSRPSALCALLVAVGLWAASPASAAPPANDAFADARVVGGPLPITVPGANVEATSEAGEPVHALYSVGASVWYSWTPAETAQVELGACDATFSATIAVYTGDDVGSLTTVETATNGCASGSLVDFTARAGTTYRIAVDGFNADSVVQRGEFVLRIEPLGSTEVSDSFAGARELSGPLPMRVTGSNLGAGREAGEPDHGGETAYASVWYRWTPSETQRVLVDVCDTDTDKLWPLLGVYTGDSVDALTRVPSRWGACGLGAVEFTARAGATYRIAVDGSREVANPSRGDFRLKITSAATGGPANDAFADAQELTGALPLTVTGSSVGAGKEPGEPEHQGFPGGASVWYRWTPTDSQRVSIDTCGSSFVTLLGVYEGTGLDALEPVEQAGWSCDFRSDAEFSATAGTTYWIAIDGYAGADGDIALRIDVPTGPANNDFAHAEVLAGSPRAGAQGTNRGATKEPGEPDHAGNAGGASVWYSWTPDDSRRIVIETCGEPLDTTLAVYTGDAIDALTPLASNDDKCGNNSSVAIDAIAGTTYRIAVDGFRNSRGSIARGRVSLTVRPAGPANDYFHDARVLTENLPIRFADSNAGAGYQPGEDASEGSGSIWYRWTPDRTRKVTLTTCGSELATWIRVLRGSLPISALRRVAGNELGCGPWDNGSLMSFVAEAGTTYHIVVEGTSGLQGFGSFDFTLRDAVAPANDDLENAESLPRTLPLRVAGTTADATQEPGEPNHEGLLAGSSSVWYVWTAERSGAVTVETCDGDALVASKLSVYTGDTAHDLQRVAAAGDGDLNYRSACGRLGKQARVSFFAHAGTTYRIALTTYGRYRAQGSFVLAMRAAPPNDPFADAQPIDGAVPAHVSGTTRDATVEPEEPGDGSPSVWYRWTPRESGRFTADVCGSGSELELAAYTGASVGDLTPVSATRSRCDAIRFGTRNRITFTATAGTTYRLAVAGSEGDVDLVIRAARPRPDNDDLADAEVLRDPLPLRLQRSNVGATREAGEPVHGGTFFPGHTSIWFRWTPTHSGPVALDSCGSAISNQVSVYTGATVTALHEVATTASGCSYDAPVTFAAKANTTYVIAIDGEEGQAGAVELRIRAARRPVNDDFADARMLANRLPVSTSGTNLDATSEAGEPPDPRYAGDGRSVWYRWTAPATGDVTVETCGSGPEAADGTAGGTVLKVFTGDDVDDLTPVDGTRGRCGSRHDTTTIHVEEGTAYRIAVEGRYGAAGPLELTIRPTRRPANDDFGSPQALPPTLPVTVESSNVDATRQTGEPDGNVLNLNPFDPAGASIWFSWTAPTSGLVHVDTCGSSFDTLLGVFGEDDLGALENLVTWFSDNSCGEQGLDTFQATAGRTYRILVAGSFGAQGAVKLHVAAAAHPANDRFADAQVLTGDLPISVSGTNVDAFSEPYEYLHTGSSVWYRWTADVSGPVVVDTCGTEFQTYPRVFTGAALASLELVADEGGTCGEQDLITFAATAGTTYSISIDGAGEGRISLKLRRPQPPRNDRFANAERLEGSGRPVRVTGTNVDATREPGEPHVAGAGSAASVWYRWTPQESRQVTIDTCGSTFPAALAVFTGSTPGQLDRVESSSAAAYGDGCAASGKVTFAARAGTTYSIVVDGELAFQSKPQGAISLGIDAPAPAFRPPWWAHDIPGLQERFGRRAFKRQGPAALAARAAQAVQIAAQRRWLPAGARTRRERP